MDEEAKLEQEIADLVARIDELLDASEALAAEHRTILSEAEALLAVLDTAKARLKALTTPH